MRTIYLSAKHFESVQRQPKGFHLQVKGKKESIYKKKQEKEQDYVLIVAYNHMLSFAKTQLIISSCIDKTIYKIIFKYAKFL